MTLQYQCQVRKSWFGKVLFIYVHNQNSIKYSWRALFLQTWYWHCKLISWINAYHVFLKELFICIGQYRFYMCTSVSKLYSSCGSEGVEVGRSSVSRALSCKGLGPCAWQMDLHGGCICILGYFLFEPVVHNWSIKGRVMCSPVCGKVHIQNPLLLIGNIWWQRVSSKENMSQWPFAWCPRASENQATSLDKINFPFFLFFLFFPSFLFLSIWSQ